MDEDSRNSAQHVAIPPGRTLTLAVILNALAGAAVLWFGGFVNHRFEALGVGFQLLNLLLLLGVLRQLGYLRLVILGESCALIALTLYFISIFPRINFGDPSQQLPVPTFEAYGSAAAYGAVPLLVFGWSALLALKSTRSHRSLTKK